MVGTKQEVGMEIKQEKPPNYEAICKVLTPGEDAVFTYGSTLYCPHLKDMSRIQDHLLVHEEVHVKQQTNPEEWWDRYLKDPAFRLEQELEAYATQYAFVDKKNILYKWKKHFLGKLAMDLSSPMYGNILSYGEAESKIRNTAKTIDVSHLLPKEVSTPVTWSPF